MLIAMASFGLYFSYTDLKMLEKVLLIKLPHCYPIFQDYQTYGGSFIYHFGGSQPLVAIGLVVNTVILLCIFFFMNNDDCFYK